MSKTYPPSAELSASANVTLAQYDAMYAQSVADPEAFWAEHGIQLIDAKYEFGRDDGRIVLADELSPDGCRLWEAGTGRKLDKDVFRRDLAGLGDTYRELHARVFGA